MQSSVVRAMAQTTVAQCDPRVMSRTNKEPPSHRNTDRRPGDSRYGHTGVRHRPCLPWRDRRRLGVPCSHSRCSSCVAGCRATSQAVGGIRPDVPMAPWGFSRSWPRMRTAAGPGILDSVPRRSYEGISDRHIGRPPPLQRGSGRGDALRNHDDSSLHPRRGRVPAPPAPVRSNPCPCAAPVPCWRRWRCGGGCPFESPVPGRLASRPQAVQASGCDMRGAPLPHAGRPRTAGRSFEQAHSVTARRSGRAAQKIRRFMRRRPISMEGDQGWLRVPAFLVPVSFSPSRHSVE